MRVARLGLWLKRAGDDRPVDQRIKGEFVAGRIDRDRLGEFGGGPRRQHTGQPDEPLLDVSSTLASPVST